MVTCELFTSTPSKPKQKPCTKPSVGVLRNTMTGKTYKCCESHAKQWERNRTGIWRVIRIG